MSNSKSELIRSKDFEKGEDRWEVARTPKTKVTGDLKVGSKVTIYYTMTADEIEVKADKKK